MIRAGAIGIPPKDFWHLTPRELYAAFAGAEMANKRTRIARASAAWHTAMWSRSKRMPSFSDVMRRLDPPPPMDRKEMFDAIVGIGKAFGATVIVRQKEPGT